MKYLKLMYKLLTCKDLEVEKEILHLHLPNLLTERRFNRGQQTNGVYCTKCGLELTSTSWIAQWKESHHTYCCDNCGEVATYRFDIAPFPISVTIEEES